MNLRSVGYFAFSLAVMGASSVSLASGANRAKPHAPAAKPLAIIAFSAPADESNVAPLFLSAPLPRKSIRSIPSASTSTGSSWPIRRVQAVHSNGTRPKLATAGTRFPQWPKDERQIH